MNGTHERAKIESDTRRRGKYGRPCDVCASRRVRCVMREGDAKCVGCSNHGLECTNVRIRKKSGPKRGRIHGESYQELSTFVPGPTGEREELFLLFQHPAQYATIPVDKLLPHLQVYQTWFYGYWPVLSVAHLILTLVGNAQMESAHFLQLTEHNAMSYALCCSVCAFISTQVTFVSNREKVLDVQNTLPAAVYAEEARRVRNLFDYSQEPNILTLLSSFFLYAHYVNSKGRTNQAIVYLREAITISQLLGLHDPSTYVGKSAAESHRCKKIYYILFITERFMSFEDGIPVVLDPCISFPLLENEEYPSLLVGFLELIKVFSVPDKNFFGEINQKSGQNKLQVFRDYLQGQRVEEKRKWILDVQTKLGQPFKIGDKMSDSHKLNVKLLQSWIQAIAWHITQENGLLRNNTAAGDECFAVDFPFKIARDFLEASKDLPPFAFEANGPGISVKLLEIANSMTLALSNSNKKMVVSDGLSYIFLLVNRFKNDVILPADVYNKVANLISACHGVPRLLQTPQDSLIRMQIEEETDDSKSHAELESAAQVTNLDELGNAETPSLSGFSSSYFPYSYSQLSIAATPSALIPPLILFSRSATPLLPNFLQNDSKATISSSLAQVISSFMHPRLPRFQDDMLDDRNTSAYAYQ